MDAADIAQCLPTPHGDIEINDVRWKKKTQHYFKSLLHFSDVSSIPGVLHLSMACGPDEQTIRLLVMLGPFPTHCFLLLLTTG